MSSNDQIRILLIDDDYALRLMYSKAFTEHGFTVVGQAENGQKGLEMYQALKPDIVLCDIEMPVLNGVETLKAIMGDDPNACVIMLTSVKHPEVWEACLMEGARYYLNKDTPYPEIQKKVMENWQEHQRMFSRNQP
ncbi:response regulator transcription factor [Magnetococcus sp. PR-3]|uniref:response regulator transcription factor n=1 Tax=Magnetococcus sp. PR-3 TaxID=3120355 RepID=UPI002FCE3605